MDPGPADSRAASPAAGVVGGRVRKGEERERREGGSRGRPASFFPSSSPPTPPERDF